MTVFDISHTLSPALAVWPGDTPFRKEIILSLVAGDAVTLSTLVMSAHTGTHVDAPAHFDPTGPGIEDLALELFWGPAQVVTVSKTAGPLIPADLAHVDLTAAPRLLVRSRNGLPDPTVFPEAFIYPTPELAAHLARYGIRLFGSEAPSMDAVTSKDLPGHHALRRHGIAILEGLRLTDVADGLYELVALPLKIAGGDGSPVRAALRTLP
jgi:arylformamidase